MRHLGTQDSWLDTLPDKRLPLPHLSAVAHAGWVQSLTEEELVVPSAWPPPESRAEISLCLRGTATVPFHRENDTPIRQALTVTGGIGYHRGRIGDTKNEAWGEWSLLRFLRRGGWPPTKHGKPCQ